MDINKMVEKHQKIVPLKKILPFLVVIFAIGVIMVFIELINIKKPNREFFDVELKGRVTEIEYKNKDTYFLIGSKWYLMKSYFIDNISKGDSINKPDHSYMLHVYDKRSKIKWKGVVKRIIFSQDKKPK